MSYTPRNTAIPRLAVGGQPAPTSPMAAGSQSARGPSYNPSFLVTPSPSFSNPFQSDFRKQQLLQATKTSRPGQLSMTVKDATGAVPESPTAAQSYSPPKSNRSMDNGSTLNTARTDATRGTVVSHYEATGNLATGPVLQFEGYFTENVTESKDESLRVRTVGIQYFLADGTVQIREKSHSNSGMAGGRILKRQRVLKWDTGMPVEYSDFNVGAELSIYGVRYHLVSCDAFSRNFLEEQGIQVPGNEKMPTGQYDAKRSQIENHAAIRPRAEPFNDNLIRFLNNDKVVLRFFALWDDRRRTGGALHNLVLSFYVQDETLEVADMFFNEFSKRYSSQALLRRQKVPRDPKSLEKQTNLVTALSPRRNEENKKMYVTAKDLMVGHLVDLLGRKILIYDASAETRRYFSEVLGVSADLMQPLESALDLVEGNTVSDALTAAESGEDISRSVPTQPYPEYTGYGTEADSMQSVKTLHPQAPRINENKRMKYGNTSLNFVAELADPPLLSDISDARDPWQDKRKFSIRFYLATDEIVVTEAFIDGGVGGICLSRRTVELPGNRSLTYTIHDFAIGKVIDLNQRRYKIVNSDAATARFIVSEEIRKEAEDNLQSAISVFDRVLRAMPSPVVRLQWLTSLLQKVSAEVITGDELRALCVQHKVELRDEQLSSLLRKYGESVGVLNVRAFIEDISKRNSVPVSGLPTARSLLKASTTSAADEERMAVLQDSARRQAKFKAAFKVLRDAIFYRGNHILHLFKKEDARAHGIIPVRVLHKALQAAGVSITADALLHVLKEFALIEESADENQTVSYTRFLESVEHYG
ncbi:conserved mitochondrial DUF1126 domain-containing protein [Andalucia godoyi]|uniref:Conserved mitochondrial DUF1126 domain-containing protein n=1 Tax=Andalucia godoyi TaxID=505711 RepID=A0A8K0AJB6_ANDGO|nr:conserved mitochondrial DUF1126 domain-containing protein [Andalucia godoyi]|eukprot:ANDGO_08198.mRNA.1 conserved mitochondrial DUF1126 domain-containing protein